MQKAFTECYKPKTLNNLPTSDEIKELQTDHNNMLTPSLICRMMPSICGKENITKQNNPYYLFDMYDSSTDSVIINAINDDFTGSPVTISYEKCTSVVFHNTPDDIVYLYRLL